MLDKVEMSDVQALMADIGRRARAAGRVLATAPTEAKNRALAEMARAVRAATPEILAGNAKDVEAMKANGQTAAFLDRGTLSEERIEAVARALEDIVALADPVGSVIAAWDRPNGLQIERVRTPLGVIGVIYESRPNVTADAGALCLKAGNAVILRGGSDTIHSNKAIHAALQKGLKAAGLPEDAIQMVPVTDRAAVGEMLKGLDGNLDVIVPRGGKSLVARVQEEARVPVFAHLEGLVHIFVDKAADLEKAVEIVVNSKLRRTGICGALETLLVDEAVAASHLPKIVAALQDKGCEIRGDARVAELCDNVVPATEADWSTEYLDAILAVKVVPGLDAAIEHIARWGSNHTDCIVTEDDEAAAEFFKRVDSAIVLHNASTQFADGGEFGMGAEIGIATGRMHARGPVGVEQLTSFKYCVHGEGQTRP
ncbi:glutamate-5-semialdehyde dehydrogenase [Roseibium aggregatum]|uniref:Gamma-glutamyl phosphate reductase n=1 Tax=Roseibium aggregatum TaxID=187304 RepID=A0A926P2Y3_9HYPH|nr:glutamate-5-semialdehyde dehydrogenase [Roseibium aggregatum]MBD1549030.1 glutamate-5-semialdehyde dehydrogenase [Roseibium aggregatum]